MATLVRLCRTLLIALLAWQAVVTQSHAHLRIANPGASAPRVSQIGSPKQRQDGPVDCSICREVAHAGAYLTPGGLAIAPPTAPFAASTPTLPPAFRFAAAPLARRSRAPPTLLHA